MIAAILRTVIAEATTTAGTLTADLIAHLRAAGLTIRETGTVIDMSPARVGTIDKTLRTDS